MDSIPPDSQTALHLNISLATHHRLTVKRVCLHQIAQNQPDSRNRGMTSYSHSAAWHLQGDFTEPRQADSKPPTSLNRPEQARPDLPTTKFFSQPATLQPWRPFFRNTQSHDPGATLIITHLPIPPPRQTPPIRKYKERVLANARKPILESGNLNL